MSYAKFTMLAVLLLCAVAMATGAPQVITAADLKGAQARLGEGKQRFLVLPEKGFTRVVEAPLGRVRVSAWLRFNGKGKAARLVTYTLTVNGVASSLTVDALDSGQPLTCEVVNRGAPLTITLAQGEVPPEAKVELRNLQLKNQEQNEDPEKGPDTEVERLPMHTE